MRLATRRVLDRARGRAHQRTRRDRGRDARAGSGRIRLRPERERRRYGLIGMQERATALGGEFEAGPTRDGWRVSCRLPVGDRRSP